ncbi:probable LRR receptor-like serine/threonine-protein kinase At1g06840 isoform X10 [Cryptomeria japonica]|uniref:probable LRR receptor-like serine/threonine-protein kinase At1g06840 isoform X10 n=1 Tax=Cryptomeria japonica TaxID=3369 RepID=UPI0027DA304D|nr:probable LRR receptor-like serine/threonine-protein kinase At1g06840 isoform X10 [Cryptomeria japonica]
MAWLRIESSEQVNRKRCFVILIALFSIYVNSNLIQATPEGDALQTIKEMLHAEVNWIGNNPCQGWEGVNCSDNHVVDLNLSEKNLHGKLPAQIGLLSYLNSLNLTSNSIEGNIPTEIANLTNLHNLSFRYNLLTGGFPQVILKLRKLVVLRLDNTRLSGPIPSDIQQLSSLEYLYLGNCSFSGRIPTEIEKLYNLKVLSIWGNFINTTIPVELSKLTNLEILFAGNCLDSDLDSHAKCLGSSSCVSFYSQPENAQSGYRLQHHKQKHTRIVLGASISGILLLVILVVTFYVLKRKIKQAGNSQLLPVGTQSSTDTLGSDNIEPWEVPNGMRRFSLNEIVKATEGFSKTNEIGFGGFGRVYKGYLDNGCMVAIKRASPSSFQGHKEFQNEIVILSRLHHRCLVKLEGFCEEGMEQILVYEFMKNGNLNNLISNKQLQESLSWDKRIEIAIAIAQGLDYLHSNIDPPIIHRDVKPSNILLDEHFSAKLSDFGISRTTPDIINTHISTAPAGTMGYVDPQYFLRRHLAPSSDVYSYGVVLLELITGQKAIDHDRLEEFNLVEWVKIKFQEDNLESIIDRHLLHGNPLQEFLPVIKLALKCTTFDRVGRPSMKDVVQILNPLLKNHSTSKQENKPPVIEAIESSLIPYSQSSTTQETFTLNDMTFTLTGR